MNGAEALVQAALELGVDTCFANPGTTEIHLVAALDARPGIRPVLCQFEGVCTGAADGYGRMAGRPALTLTHLGPGFANGIANLHNARRARSPVVNLVGDQATWHRNADAPLTSDIESLARPVSGFVRTVASAGETARDLFDAAIAAQGVPGAGRVATLVVPADCQWGFVEPGSWWVGATRSVRPGPDAVAVERAARALRERRPAALLLGGAAVSREGLRHAHAVAAATGCRLLRERAPARVERGAGIPDPERLAYFPEQLLAQLQGLAALVLAGAPEPVAFFGYEGQPSRPLPAAIGVEAMAGPEQDALAALEALAELVGQAAPVAGGPGPPSAPDGPLNPRSLAGAVASRQPEGLVVVEEGITASAHYEQASAGCPPHTVLGLTGGAIGQSLPCAVGAALACPERPVLTITGDGSAMYTQQALWTMARESLDITVLVCANRSYAILVHELRRAGLAPGAAARRLTDLSGPQVDWPALAFSLGVPGRRAESAEELALALGEALAEPGPHLVEAVL